MQKTIGRVLSTRSTPCRAAGAALTGVRAPTLLIVGGDDPVVLDLTSRRFACSRASKGSPSSRGLRISSRSPVHWTTSATMRQPGSTGIVRLQPMEL
ncbi:MAG TPA: hypothetical protein VKA43_03285, partial [Gammaproteobacteria bacterium]|nr:hypothetical protein [Gammaproteobacteria bacterium]